MCQKPLCDDNMWHGHCFCMMDIVSILIFMSTFFSYHESRKAFTIDCLVWRKIRDILPWLSYSVLQEDYWLIFMKITP